MIRTSFKYDYTKEVYEEDFSESRTQPEMSYTPQELLVRFSQGLMPDVKNPPIFDANPDINNPNPMNNPNFDLVDYSQRMRQIEHIINEERDNPPTYPTSEPETQTPSSPTPSEL